MNKMMLFPVILCLCYVTYATASAPCFGYETFPADSTRSPSHSESVYADAKCDATLSTKWYRIVGDAGTELTNDSGLLSDYGCGTYNQMWMNGSIPEVADGVVDRQICLKTVFSNCHHTFTIQVQNCCSFRVYYLQSAGGCPHAYCVSDTSFNSTGTCVDYTTTETPTTEYVSTTTEYVSTTTEEPTTTAITTNTQEGDTSEVTFVKKDTTLIVAVLVGVSVILVAVLFGFSIHIIKLQKPVRSISMVPLCDHNFTNSPPAYTEYNGTHTRQCVEKGGVPGSAGGQVIAENGVPDMTSAHVVANAELDSLQPVRSIPTAPLSEDATDIPCTVQAYTEYPATQTSHCVEKGGVTEVLVDK